MAFIMQTGTEADDVMVGVDGNDYSFAGEGGDDTLTGANGNDAFLGGAGADTMSGGAGDDRFNYTGSDTPLDDVLDGGDGFDNIHFLSNAGEARALFLNDAMRLNIEQVTGSDGNEFFYGSGLSGAITLSGGAGNDYLEGGAGSDILVGGADADVLVGNGGGDSLFGGDGNDRVIYRAGQTNAGDFVDGGEGWDTASFESTAGSSASVVVEQASFQGMEQLDGGDGDDALDATGMLSDIAIGGGAGNDSISAGAGNDNLSGGDGDDALVGNVGNDTLDGGAGADLLYGGDGNDMFMYWNGDVPTGDTVDGGTGVDTMFFATQAGSNLSVLLDDALLNNIEQVSGMDGNDNFNGWALTNGVTLSGQGGNDYLSGGAGNDLIFGGAGSDFLRGLGGADTLVGGDADDIFIFNDAGGTWTVADFTQGLDHIWIDTFVPRDFAYVLEHAVEVEGSTHITMDGSTMIIKNVGVADLQESDFFFQY
jgi:Ca2+-binding RTX toxin-like protein